MYQLIEPEVYLVAKQEMDEQELGRFLQQEGVEHWQTDASDGGSKLVEVSGRVCYMSFAKPRPGGNQAYIDHILEVGHGSVLEHAVFSLLMTGVSRNLTHELVRHRAGFAYSQLSQRFVNESDDDEGVGVVMPPLIQQLVGRYNDPEAAAYSMTAGEADLISQIEEAWRESIQVADESYQLLDQLLRKYLVAYGGRGLPDQIQNASTAIRKKAREAARSVLPGCTETKIMVTANARAWRHLLELRGSEHADAEIQRLARLCLRKLKDASPVLFGDMEETGEGIISQHRKV